MEWLCFHDKPRGIDTEMTTNPIVIIKFVISKMDLKGMVGLEASVRVRILRDFK